MSQQNIEQQDKPIEIHRNKVKEDENDLEELKKQIDKIQKLKAQYQMQKYEINNLNYVVSALKSENSQLKIKDNVCKQKIQHEEQENQNLLCEDIQCKYSQDKSNNQSKLQNSSLIQKQIEKEQSVTSEDLLESHDRKYFNQDQENQEQKQNQNQKSIPKIIPANQNNLKYRKSQEDPQKVSYDNKLFTISQPKKDIPSSFHYKQHSIYRQRKWNQQRNLNCPDESCDYANTRSAKIIRFPLVSNRSDLPYATTIRSITPSNRLFYNQTNQFEPKKNLIENFVSQLKFELNTKDMDIMDEKRKNDEYKSYLCLCQQENMKLIQLNNRISEESELMKQRYELTKEQLKKQVSSKIHTESKLTQFISNIKYGSQLWDMQLDKMDQIYKQFQSTDKLINHHKYAGQRPRYYPY